MKHNLKKNLIFLSASVCISLLLLSSSGSVLSAQEEMPSYSEKTVLYLHKWEYATFNGGQSIVFEGKLTTESGERIPHAKIIIKNDGPCPENRIIAEGITDKKGHFWISIITKVWDESDNLIKVHAEFEGNDNFLPSVSDEHLVVIYQVNAEKCIN
ncbi:MAG: hypothetical protein ACR2LL_11845 [Nitrosopumilus sp.]|uniref:hypothetical protein n=1 Tax=Nitrosopumilus sp. TaxID=2024843 RepID=UPI00292D10FA|nr:hypothetical protein [Nitrosopumilus sp.]